MPTIKQLKGDFRAWLATGLFRLGAWLMGCDWTVTWKLTTK